MRCQHSRTTGLRKTSVKPLGCACFAPPEDKGVAVPLVATDIELHNNAFTDILQWPFADPFVARLLSTDIRQRWAFGNCRILIYTNEQKQIVGFGTIDVC